LTAQTLTLTPNSLTFAIGPRSVTLTPQTLTLTQQSLSFTGGTYYVIVGKAETLTTISRESLSVTGSENVRGATSVESLNINLVDVLVNNKESVLM
jgi:hypothetical protein